MALSPHVDWMYNRLKSAYRFTTVKIATDQELCLKRVWERDQRIHANVSYDLLSRINREIINRNIQCEFMNENNRAKEAELIKNIGLIIEKTEVSL